jgi:uncharacterized protein YuzE
VDGGQMFYAYNWPDRYVSNTGFGALETDLMYVAYHPESDLVYVAYHPESDLVYVAYHPESDLMYVTYHLRLT